MRDRDTLFHERWLGLAQPIEGLVFSVPVLADAQIAPDLRVELTNAFRAQLTDPTTEPRRIRSLPTFFRELLGYSEEGMLVPRAALPEELSFYAAEGGQEIRPSYALGRGPFESNDVFATPTDDGAAPSAAPGWFALLWDLTESGEAIDLDAHENITGAWRYPPTAKFERLLRHAGIPIGFLFNGTELRLVYAPAGESTAHLTFRVEHMERSDGRPLLAAMELLLHARRAYTASPAHTLEGLLAESRRRQADVTGALAKQVFEAVEILVAGFESAAARDLAGNDRPDWLRAAMEAEGDHLYQGVLSIVLRLVFLLYAEDQSLLPVEHPTYAAHLSLSGLHARLSHDAGAHPESMHHRFGAYGQLLSLFRSVYFGVKHGTLSLPPRRGRLFDPNAFPFLEGGLPEWTAAVLDPAARAAAHPPSIDDRCVYDVLHRLVVFEGQRLSYRTLDVEQIGSVYESLMGYHVLRLVSPAVRLCKHGVWVEAEALRALNKTERAKFLKETCGLNPGPITSIETALATAKSTDEAAEILAGFAAGKKGDTHQHRAAVATLVLQPGEERRRTASHYTPRSLTEKVVRRTLEPLLACLGPVSGEGARTPEQILELKICDPAMGSGAFLVATCRELASEIVAAWTRQGDLAKIIEAHDDAHLHARRLVAQKCLYGVDKNGAAVELAKLSLWLVTLSKALPFTFVDHALRHGDSLVGLNFDQIAAFHWTPPKQAETFRPLVQEALEQAVDLRQQILALADREDVDAQSEKRRLLEFSQQAIDRVRTLADLCVGAFFAETKDAAREKERKRRADLVHRWLGGDAEAAGEVGGLASEARARLTPFHWWIEFPEVFFAERPDPLQGGVKNGAALMEGVVGNPPFGGKNTGDLNTAGYIEWLKATIPGSHGNADLSAYFFRRAGIVLGEHGAFGLIATNTIAQGDTRTTGLAFLVRNGWRIFDATDSMAWPGGAAVTVSIVHAGHGKVSAGLEAHLGGRPVPEINSLLKPKPERIDPVSLSSNAGASVGSYVLGMGFRLTPSERRTLIETRATNGERIFPIIGGEEVNTSSIQGFEGYIINFGQLPLAKAEQWPELMAIVRAKIKPERDRLRESTGPGAHGKKYWWQFVHPRQQIYDAIQEMKRCLVTACVSKHLMFSFQPTDRVFSHKLCVFPLDSFTAWAVLQSRVHHPWTWLLSSTMKTDLNYSASDCFETFPFPQSDPRTVLPALETAGQALYDARAAFMVETNQGLTKTYNALKAPSNDDPRILALRQLHEAMDRAVLEAYGWTDLAARVPPYCPLNDTDKAALTAFEDEVIDRLYVLNAERAREEERLGLKSGKGAAKKGPSAAKSPKTKEPSTDGGDGQGALF